MTLDEAIKHCTEIVDECMKEMEKVPECHHDTYAPYVRTKERANEYAHYVEWLEELKYYRETIPEVMEIKSELLKMRDEKYQQELCPFGQFGEWYNGFNDAVEMICNIDKMFPKSKFAEKYERVFGHMNTEGKWE